MSHIFDALQRAEDERRGKTGSSGLAATELLERAEHEARVEPTPVDRVAKIVEMPVVGEDPEQLLIRSTLEEDSRPQHEPIRTALPGGQTLHITPPFHDRLVALSDPSSPAAEAFRLLCVRLRHVRRNRPLTSILISSTSPEEGKSFAAANLACTLALGGQQNVLLLEGDVRRPSQGKIFRLRDMAGLCECLRGQRTLTESIHRIEEAGIWILPAGHESGKSPELLDSAKLTPMVQQMSRWFDWVIIDSPPVLPLADTSVWEKMADGVLIVARRGVTAKRKLKRGTEAIDKKKLIGAILNSSTRSKDEEYYHYRRPAAEPEPEETI
jgi:capsular exopolysaccharide synthesis family protein